MRNFASRTFTVFTLHIFAGELLEGQEAVAFRAIVDKDRFERWLDASNFGFVDIAFTLLLTSVFDVEINEFLSVDDSNAQLFCLRCVE